MGSLENRWRGFPGFPPLPRVTEFRCSQGDIIWLHQQVTTAPAVRTAIHSQRSHAGAGLGEIGWHAGRSAAGHAIPADLFYMPNTAGPIAPAAGPARQFSLRSVDPEDSSGRSHRQEPFEVHRSGFRDHAGGQDDEKRPEVGDGCGEERGAGGPVAVRRVPGCPGRPLEAEGQSDGEKDERDSAGLGMKATRGHRRCAGVADQDQGYNADHVQHPGSGLACRQHHERLGKAELAAKKPKPRGPEYQDQHHSPYPEHSVGMATSKRLVLTANWRGSQTSSMGKKAQHALRQDFLVMPLPVKFYRSRYLSRHSREQK